MDYEDLKRKAESILFSAGKRIEFGEIRKLCRCRDPELLKSALSELKKEYDNKDSSLMIVEEGNFWKMIVKERYTRLVRRIVSDTELSKTIMETLAVVAWKHPVLQSDVIKIRTNKAYDHLNELEELGFISRKKKGRTKEIKLTNQFYKYFELEGDYQIKEIFKDVKEEDHIRENKDNGKSPELEVFKELKTPEPGQEDRKIIPAINNMESEHLGVLEVFETSEQNSKPQDKGIEQESRQEQDISGKPREITAPSYELENGSEFDSIVEEPDRKDLNDEHVDASKQFVQSDDQTEEMPSLDEPVIGERIQKEKKDDYEEETSEGEKSITSKLDEFEEMLEEESRNKKKKE